MRNPNLRYIAILELIPREPDSITVAQLLHKLDDKYPPSRPRSDIEFKAEIRKTQRDLNKLYEQHPLGFHREGKKREFLWYWLESAPALIFPCLDSHTALILALAKQYLDPILPIASVKALANLFNRAEERLGRQNKNYIRDGARSWRHKVALAPTGIARILPQANPRIENIIYDALLNEQAVKITYQAWNTKQVKEYIISPNGLIVRSQLIYLVAVNHSHGKTTNLLTHRIKAAEIVDDGFKKLEGFEAQEYVSHGGLGFALDALKPKISLHIRLDDQPLTGIKESPISKDQKILQENEKWFSLTATVDNTLELRQWLRSHAHHIEVIEPKELRDEFMNSAISMMTTYNK